MLSRPLVIALAAAVAAGLLCAGLLIQRMKPDDAKQETPVSFFPQVEMAVAYVQAVQQGQWDYVIDHTGWMQDRLARVSLEKGSPEAINQAREELRARLRDRSAKKACLQREGLEDQYVFMPGAVIRCIGCDTGRQGLDRPVAARVWFEVQYPGETRAPVDEEGRPVPFLEAGVNLSEDGLVLKAGIAGNVELSREKRQDRVQNGP